MELIIESTSKIVKLNGIDCRVWEGRTGRGVKVHAFIVRVGAKDDQDLSQFEEELREQRVPSVEVAAIPLRMLI